MSLKGRELTAWFPPRSVGWPGQGLPGLLYPGAGPLKVSGHKFWIEVQDPGAVQVTQDGQPIGAGQSDIQIE